MEDSIQRTRRSTVRRGPGAPSYAAPECENDAGGRFTIRRSTDSQGSERATDAVATSCGQAARSSGAGRAARAVAGATPRPEGLVRHSGELVFTTRHPPSRGRSRVKDPCRKAVQRPHVGRLPARPPAVRWRGGLRSASRCGWGHHPPAQRREIADPRAAFGGVSNPLLRDEVLHPKPDFLLVRHLVVHEGQRTTE